ncbi:MAG: acyltransferase family protein [Alphaproteobacteria bacterium]
MTRTPSRWHLQYVPALDGVRAIAVLLVILSHAGAPGVTGNVGVDMFFVLSGFLITSLLLEEMDANGRINVLHFYVRRALRLYPALLLMLFLYGLSMYLLRHRLPAGGLLEAAKDITFAALYLTDYAVAFGFQPRGSLIAHTWSLAVEEHFYLVWPWALIALNRACKGRSLLMALLGLFVAATAWRLLCLYFQPWENVYFRFDTRMAGLVLGSLLAACRARSIKITGIDVWLALSGIACAILVVATPSMAMTTATTTVTEVFTFFLIYKITDAETWRPVRALGHRIPVFFGRLSYALYLSHFPITALLIRSDVPWWISLEVTMALSVAFAWFSWNTVERVGRLKARDFRSTGPRGQSASESGRSEYKKNNQA